MIREPFVFARRRIPSGRKRLFLANEEAVVLCFAERGAAEKRRQKPEGLGLADAAGLAGVSVSWPGDEGRNHL